MVLSTGRRGWGPETGVVRSEVPRGGAAHAEAADHDAVFVDLILALHGIQRFEEVHFAGELAGVAVASVNSC
jgi:hypothetical protein